MKYYSYIDHLNLTVDELINLSPYKLKEIINELSEVNTKRKNILISGLEDSASRSYHITIEKNAWLKNILFKNFNELKKSKIQLKLDYINYISGFKLFLELYLRPILPDLINQLIHRNELRLLLHILNQSDLFSNNCEIDIIRLLKSKIDYATLHLNQNQIGNPDRDLKYIRSYLFYEIINLYEPHLKDELIKLYDSITDIVNQYNVNSNDQIFMFVSQAQVAFQKSRIDDVSTKLFIDNNAENAKSYAYKYSSKIELDTRKTLFQRFGLISIFSIVTVSIIIFIMTYSRKQNSNTEQETYKAENYNNKKKRTAYDNRIRFYYSLKRITKKAKINKVLLNETKLPPYSNPFPKTFNLISNDTVAYKDINVQIENKTGYDLIVFKIIKGKDESIYIPEDKSIFISLHLKDSLLFYSGNNFATSKFSHFREHMVISDMYKVTKINNASFSTISVTPIDSINKFEKRLISKKDIKTTENIELNKMSLDNLYRIYYRKYSN